MIIFLGCLFRNVFKFWKGSLSSWVELCVCATLEVSVWSFAPAPGSYVSVRLYLDKSVRVSSLQKFFI